MSATALSPLDYERPRRTRYGILAFIAAVLIVGSQLIQLSGNHTSVSELTLTLITINSRFPLDIVGAVVNSAGLAAIAALLVWLHRASVARNPEYRSFIGRVVVGGAVISALCAIVYWSVLSGKASTFTSTGQQTYPQARALMSGWGIVAPQILGEIGSLFLAAGIIWISLNAMRVGLLTKMIGYVGVLAGALVLFPIGAIVPVVQGFWLAAVALTVAGRWPSGDPPAWVQGIAVPWPAAGGAAARQPRQRRPRGGGPLPTRATDPAPVPAPTASATNGDAGERTRANTSKRKRKRRG